MPLTCGCVAGDVAPAAMKTLGVAVTFEGSLLVSVRNTPPAGAAVANVSGNDVDCPSAMITLAETMIPDDDEAVTVTLAFALPKFGVLAVIVAEPAATPVTDT